MDAIRTVKRAATSETELERCRRSSWYLAVNVLDYGWNPRKKKGLTERLHKPILDWFDRNDDDLFIGLWMGRTRHKTTMVIVKIIQAILRDPCKAHRYFHAVDDEAEKVFQEIVHHFKHNKKLRALDPVGRDEQGRSYNIFPSPKKSRWDSGSEFTVNRHEYNRAPTLSCRGASSEVTGAHIDGDCWLDDIIAYRTIINSELGKVASWVRNTVFPVVDSKRIRGTGTPWSEHSIHQEWMADPEWRTLIIPGAIAEDDAALAAIPDGPKKQHFKPDYKFTNPVFGPVSFREQARKMLRIEQDGMKGHFPPQIMCDPEPAAERPWSASCEQFTPIRAAGHLPGIGGPGTIFVLSDPAPWLQGSYKGLTEKQRGDGSKDWWSIQVWKHRPRGTLMDFILLDGAHSQEWGHQQGADVAATFMKRYATTYFFTESPDEHFSYMRVACSSLGIRLTRAPDGGPLRFDEYNRTDRKNANFMSFAEKAAAGEVWICETVPQELLHGDGDHTGLLTQARKWRKIAQNKNSLRFDDDADCASRNMDPALARIGPRPEVVKPFFENDEDEGPMMSRSRYCVA